MISINFTDNIRTRRKIYGIVGAILTLMVPFVLMHFSSGSHLETEQSLCPFKMLTGFPCPGCGITKSLVYLYEGNLLKSLQFHLLGPFVILFSLLLIPLLLTEIATGKEYFQNIFYNRKLAWTLGILLMTYHFIRIVYFVATTSADEILTQSIWR